MQNFRKLTISALAEPGKRLVSACLAVAILASSCPLASYARANAGSAAQHPLPQPPAAAEGSRRSGEAEKHRGAGRQRPVGRQPASPSGNAAAQLLDSIGLSGPLTAPAQVVEDEVESVGGRLEVTPVDTVDVDLNRRSLSERFPEYAADSLTAGEALLADSIAAEARKPKPDEWVEREVAFNPDPTRAVWMSALFPGLGQIYNRRYWKLPIIVGGYMSLAYATNWNNWMLSDYTKA
ncbi:MAG: hypothetical protein K2L62_01060, partial [Muribaculaceae bacterium]|nr:hypothetical protein [Muribaculaceae bacterium]